MSEFKGTKGKWYLQEYTDSYTNIIRCDNGKGADTIFLASTPQSTSPEERYNALLISKSLEMLSILEKLVEYQDDYFGDFPKTHQAFKKLAYEAEQLIKEATE
ncbi:hypothetical protein CMU85_18155 [Elizabethkingia anophelis]|nr:hypothetical protein [Elizabethkingia anophelis]